MALSDQLTQPLRRLRARYAQSPLPRFLHWWGGELRALLPERWRQRFEVEDAWVLLRCDGDEVQVLRQRGEMRDELGRLPAQPPEALPGALADLLGEEGREQRRVLLLPGDAILRRTLTLPAAALENLDTVLGFELDRQTPFKPDQVRFDSRVLPHEAEAKQVPVQFALVTRERLAKELARIDGLASSLSAVDAVDAHGARAGFNFLPQEQRAGRSHLFGWTMAGLLFAALLFSWMALGKIIENRRDAIAALEQQVEEARDEARAVTKLRNELDDAAAGANFLAVEKASQPSMLLLLDELTQLLPDDTYLERLSVVRGEVSLSGQSRQAAKLVEILGGSKLLRSPALSGPIQPDPRSGMDRFNITGRYGPVDTDKEEGGRQ
mgnify:CR=1 FL=1